MLKNRLTQSKFYRFVCLKTLQKQSVCDIIIMIKCVIIPFCRLHKENEEEKELMIILASGSPRRREILSELGAELKIITADVDESSNESDPERLAEYLARKKGLAVYEKLLSEKSNDADLPIISADTVVFCDGEIMGKPIDENDARRMLKKLSGKAHTVTTGICVINGGLPYSSYSTTKVFVDSLTDDEINAYIKTRDPLDKAGGYGIQGVFSKHIGKIEGCYFNVVGLPTNALAKLFYKATGRGIS